MADQSQGRELQPHRPPEGITESDYEAIEDAVMETARGRWFLKEYARRMRAAETAGLLTALERIEKMVAAANPPQAGPQTQTGMPTDISHRIEGISERLLDISWYMRERGIDGSACAAIDAEARQLTGLMTPAVIETTDIEIYAPPEPEPVPKPRDIIREPRPIDETVKAPAQPQGQIKLAEPPPASLVAKIAALVHIDRMPVRQKLALFA